MAIVETRVDDMTGDPGAQLLTFSVGLDTWEIDVTEATEKRLRDALRPFIDVARPTTKMPRQRQAEPVDPVMPRLSAVLSDAGSDPNGVMSRH